MNINLLYLFVSQDATDTGIYQHLIDSNQTYARVIIKERD